MLLSKGLLELYFEFYSSIFLLAWISDSNYIEKIEIADIFSKLEKSLQSTLGAVKHMEPTWDSEDPVYFLRDIDLTATAQGA